ncbi:unnamed protein product, partial [Prorocentrum cordatum]
DTEARTIDLTVDDADPVDRLGWLVQLFEASMVALGEGDLGDATVWLQSSGCTRRDLLQEQESGSTSWCRCCACTTTRRSASRRRCRPSRQRRASAAAAPPRRSPPAGDEACAWMTGRRRSSTGQRRCRPQRRGRCPTTAR